MSVTPYRDAIHHEATEPAVELEIAGRQRDLGDGFSVRRLLPSQERRMVGPFIFADHMGPLELLPGHALDVRPHPHVNLATVTYLFAGEILHRDSLGTEQLIRAGELNWMTAGRGIVHSERTPAQLRKTGGAVHGMQLWVALPTDKEEIDASFQHHSAESLPLVERSGVRLRIIAGSAFGARAPVELLSPLFYVEADIDRGADLRLPDEHRERAAYVVEGGVSVAGKTYRPGVLVVFKPDMPVTMRALEPARVLLLGGAPLDGERHIWWNFVSSRKERIERAKDDWRNRRFAIVPGDENEFIPLPEGS
jgi:redox-sensitive bicupin YhaK (pirin superfamily)